MLESGLFPDLPLGAPVSRSGPHTPTHTCHDLRTPIPTHFDSGPSLHLLVLLHPLTLGQRQLPQGTGEAEMGTVGEEEREAEAGTYRVPITGLQ